MEEDIFPFVASLTDKFNLDERGIRILNRGLSSFEFFSAVLLSSIFGLFQQAASILGIFSLKTASYSYEHFGVAHL